MIAVKKKDEKQATRFLDYVRYPLTIGAVSYTHLTLPTKLEV